MKGQLSRKKSSSRELASSEFLLQQLRNLLEAGGQEMLDSLPDGIHSGLIKGGARGVLCFLPGSLTWRVGKTISGSMLT